MTVARLENPDETQRWETEKVLHSASEEWAAAFVAAQAELTNPKTDSKANIRSDKGSFSYAYLSLPALIDHVRGVLAKHGLAFSQDVRGNGPLVAVFTTVWHTVGHSETFGPLEMPAGGNAQAWGSAITYAKRYALAAVLGIAAEEDDDAQTQVKVSKQKASASPPAAPFVTRSADEQASSERSTPADADGGLASEADAPPTSSAAPEGAGTEAGGARQEPAGHGEGPAGSEGSPQPPSTRDALWNQLVQFAGTKRKALNAVNTTMKASYTEPHIADIPPDDLEHTLRSLLQREGVA